LTPFRFTCIILTTLRSKRRPRHGNASAQHHRRLRYATAPRALSFSACRSKAGATKRPTSKAKFRATCKARFIATARLFERGGLRKPHLLDGDGLVQRLSFANGKVHYRNAFVRTSKFIAEKRPILSASRPGRCGVRAACSPISAAVRSLAGRRDGLSFNDILYAFDEISPAYGVDPQTLETSARRLWAIRRENSWSRPIPNSTRRPANGCCSASATVVQ